MSPRTLSGGFESIDHLSAQDRRGIILLTQLIVTRLAICRFVAYLDDAAPSEAEIIVWSEHHIANGDEVQKLGIMYLTSTCFNLRCRY